MVQPLKKCCWCCCSLRVGVLIAGCAWLGFDLLGAILSSIQWDPNAIPPSPADATDYCLFSKETREAYEECFGGDPCDCGAAVCDFAGMSAAGRIPDAIGMLLLVGDFLLFPLGFRGIHKFVLGHLNKFFLWNIGVYPLLALVSTIISAASSSGSSAFTTAASYKWKIIHNMVCNTDVASAGENPADDIAVYKMAEDSAGEDFECTDFAETNAGAPEGGRACPAASMRMVFGVIVPFVSTLFFIFLRVFYAFHIWSLKRECADVLHKAEQEKAAGGTPLPISPAWAKPVVATATVVKSTPEA